jgi:hypothetical protein
MPYYGETPSGDGGTLTYVETRTYETEKTGTSKWVNYRGPYVWFNTRCGGKIVQWIYLHTS